MSANIDWLAGRKYLAMLASLLLLLVVYPAVHAWFDTRLAFDILLAGFFMTALVTVFHGRQRLPAVLLGVPTLAGLWLGYVLPGLPRLPVVLFFHAAAGVFLAFALGAILAAVHRDAGVNADSVHGALCGYVLAGLVFGHIYCALEAAAPGSFQAAGPPFAGLSDDGRTHIQLTYFSFVTLTTVGYGDITPTAPAARSVAILEAVVGQFYIAVLIAELIGKRASGLPR